MRNALGLMLGSVAAAAVIAGAWLWSSASHAKGPPAAPRAPLAERLAAATPAKPRDDVEVTGSITVKPPVAAPQPLAFKNRVRKMSHSVARTVVIDIKG